METIPPEKLKQRNLWFNLCYWLEVDVFFIQENIKSSLETKQYIHIVITCLVTLATQDTLKMCDITQKPEKDLQEKEKELITNMSAILKDDIFNGSNEQLEVIYALQIFCYEKQFPKGKLPSLPSFSKNHNCQIILFKRIFMKILNINPSNPSVVINFI